MARCDDSIYVLDLVEYAETAAHYELESVGG